MFDTTNWEVRGGQWISWQGKPLDLTHPTLGDQAPEDLMIESLATRLHTLSTLNVSADPWHGDADRDRFIRTEGEIEGILTAVHTLRPDLAAEIEATAQRLADGWPY